MFCLISGQFFLKDQPSMVLIRATVVMKLRGQKALSSKGLLHNRSAPTLALQPSWGALSLVTADQGIERAGVPTVKTACA